MVNCRFTGCWHLEDSATHIIEHVHLDADGLLHVLDPGSQSKGEPIKRRFVCVLGCESKATPHPWQRAPESGSGNQRRSKIKM